jgi:hypothetical protein
LIFALHGNANHVQGGLFRNVLNVFAPPEEKQMASFITFLAEIVLLEGEG